MTVRTSPRSCSACRGRGYHVDGGPWYPGRERCEACDGAGALERDEIGDYPSPCRTITNAVYGIDWSRLVIMIRCTRCGDVYATLTGVARCEQCERWIGGLK